MTESVEPRTSQKCTCVDFYFFIFKVAYPPKDHDRERGATNISKTHMCGFYSIICIHYFISYLWSHEHFKTHTCDVEPTRFQNTHIWGYIPLCEYIILDNIYHIFYWNTHMWCGANVFSKHTYEDIFYYVNTLFYIIFIFRVWQTLSRRERGGRQEPRVWQTLSRGKREGGNTLA